MPGAQPAHVDRFYPASRMNTDFRPASPALVREILTVSQLNRAVAGLLERSLSVLAVAGELSNVTRAVSGHWYFSLKDAGAQVRCVMFRGRARYVDFAPREGDHVHIRALPTLYEARGEFQLTVESMRRAGAGELYRRFLQLKEALQREGLFEPGRKRRLPSAPATVGIVTSLQAAALRDVLTTLRRRAPGVAVVLYPTSVQGDDAPARIAAAIAGAGARGECEVLLLVRGGGSIEDLWAFNEEVVARAIVACAIPVISGVGHETDFTIADFVADLRAATPTAAAELVAADRRELARHVRRLAERLRSANRRLLDHAAQRLDTSVRLLRAPSAQWRDRTRRLTALAQRLAAARAGQALRRSGAIEQLAARLRAPRADLAAQRLASLERRLHGAIHEVGRRSAHRLDAAAATLALVSPQAVLDRGYAIVSGIDGAVLRDSNQAGLGQSVIIRLAAGELDARVTGIRPAAATP